MKTKLQQVLDLIDRAREITKPLPSCTNVDSCLLDAQKQLMISMEWPELASSELVFDAEQLIAKHYHVNEQLATRICRDFIKFLKQTEAT